MELRHIHLLLAGVTGAALIGIGVLLGTRAPTSPAPEQNTDASALARAHTTCQSVMQNDPPPANIEPKRACECFFAVFDRMSPQSKQLVAGVYRTVENKTPGVAADTAVTFDFKNRVQNAFASITLSSPAQASALVTDVKNIQNSAALQPDCQLFLFGNTP